MSGTTGEPEELVKVSGSQLQRFRFSLSVQWAEGMSILVGISGTSIAGGPHTTGGDTLLCAIHQIYFLKLRYDHY